MVDHQNRYTYDALDKKLRLENQIYIASVAIPQGTITQIPLNTTTTSGKTVTDYVGKMIYQNGTLKEILTPEGYWQNGLYYYYLKDHQGSTREVLRQDNTVMEYSDYYPDGMRFWTSTSNSAALPYRYNGKELEAMNGLNEYDYGARRRETGIPVWTTVDPLAEKYYSISPYAYCLNNPVLYIDPFGLWTAVSGGYSTNDPNDISNFMGYYQSQQAVGNTNPTTNQMLNYVSDVVDNKQPHLSDGSLFLSQVNVVKNPFGWEPEYKSYKTAWDEINQYQFRGKASVGGQNNVSDIDGIIGTGGDILGHVVNPINGASKLTQFASKISRFMSIGGGALSTYLAYKNIASGTSDTKNAIDAGLGGLGLTASVYSRFTGVEIPYIGEFVALYGATSLVWDASFNLGAKYGPMTYLVNHLGK